MKIGLILALLLSTSQTFFVPTVSAAEGDCTAKEVIQNEDGSYTLRSPRIEFFGHAITISSDDSDWRGICTRCGFADYVSQMASDVRSGGAYTVKITASGALGRPYPGEDGRPVNYMTCRQPLKK